MDHKVTQGFRNAYLFVRDVFHEFSRDRGSLFAAAISFYTLLSIIPLILLGIAVFGYFIGSREQALQAIVSAAGDYLPTVEAANEFQRTLEEISDQSSILGGIGLLALLWVGSQVFAILQQVMDVALGAERHVGFIRGRLMALGTVLVVGGLFVVSIVLTSLLTAVRAFDVRIWGAGTEDLRIVWDILGTLLPIAISILAFTLAYRFLPSKNIGWTAPLVAGVVAGLLFEAAKLGFRWYVTSIANFSAVYGSLASLVVGVVWVYYVSVITVLGAEVASVYSRRRETKGNR